MSLQVKDLTKNYGHHRAVDKITFSALPGEIVGFLGPNGAGKSTTMKIIMGYIAPTSGQVTVCGLSPTENPIRVKKLLGYLPERNPLYDELYVIEYLIFMGRLSGLSVREARKQTARMIEQCGLTQEQNKRIGQLSKGYRQRVGLAQAMLHEPKVLILDEPSSGLDPNQIVEIRKVIKQVSQNKTVLFSTHILQEVEALCDRVIILHQGKIVANDTLDALTHDGKTTLENTFHSLTQITNPA